jgi:hypothetical protein
LILGLTHQVLSFQFPYSLKTREVGIVARVGAKVFEMKKAPEWTGGLLSSLGCLEFSRVDDWLNLS